MEFFCSYQSADFDKNYTKYDGEDASNLVYGGFLFKEDESQDCTYDYGGLPDRGDIAGLGLGKQVVDQEDYGIADEAAVAYYAGIFPFASEGVPHMAEGVTPLKHKESDG